MTTLIYLTLSSDQVIRNSFHHDLLQDLENYFSDIIILCWGVKNRYQIGKLTYFSGNLIDWYRATKKLTKAGLIYGNDYFIGGLFSVYLKKKTKAPFFLRIGSPWKYSLSSPLAWAKQVAVKVLQPYVINQSDFVVYNSKAVVYTGLEHKHSIIYNGVDTTLFRPLPPLRKDHENKRLKILFIGNINREKGLDYLFEAVKDLQDKISLTIVGDGPLLEIYQQKYPFAYFLGRKQHRELPLIINDQDVLVHPSYVESFPNVILEAMACGKPVIANKVYGIPEIVEEGVNGFLIPPQNQGRLRDSFIRALNNKKLLRNYGAEGRKKVIRQFNLEVQKMLLYQNIKLLLMPRK